jgi:hypothetical protein
MKSEHFKKCSSYGVRSGILETNKCLEKEGWDRENILVSELSLGQLHVDKHIHIFNARGKFGYRVGLEFYIFTGF